MSAVHAFFEQSERCVSVALRGLLIQFHSLGAAHGAHLSIDVSKRQRSRSLRVQSRNEPQRLLRSVASSKFTKSSTEPIEEIRQDRLQLWQTGPMGEIATQKLTLSGEQGDLKTTVSLLCQNPIVLDCPCQYSNVALRITPEHRSKAKLASAGHCVSAHSLEEREKVQDAGPRTHPVEEQKFCRRHRAPCDASEFFASIANNLASQSFV